VHSPGPPAKRTLRGPARSWRSPSAAARERSGSCPALPAALPCAIRPFW